MKKHFYILACILLSLFSFQSKASHIVGCDISYKCTSTPGVYTVTMKIYRECSGITLCSGCTNTVPNGNVTGCTTSSSGFSTSIIGATAPYVGVNYGSFTLNVVPSSSGYDIIQLCNNVKTICTNCNTRTAGTLSPGIEVFTYEGNVDLSSLPTACCKVIFAASVCCRNSAVSISTSGVFQEVCELNRCQSSCNSAPTFTNDAIPLVCAGVDIVYNLGANDPDGDSLSYAFGESYQGLNTPVNYNAPYRKTNPFPYLNAPDSVATYPGGLRIDPVTGDIMFRTVGVFISYLVIEVTQWKLVGGIRVNVGMTRRDVQFQSNLCVANKAPIIKIYKNNVFQSGINSFTTTVGAQLCLDIVTEDSGQVSPAIIADTTDLKWNNPGLYIPAMANATFTRNYILNQRVTNGPKADSFKFCWTPPISAIRQQPYLFTVNGSDRFCPIKAFAIRGITIKVEAPKTIFIDSTTKSIYCNNRITNTNVNYRTSGLNLLSGNVFTVQLSDSSGSFTNANTIGTKAATDTVGFIPVSMPTGLFLNRNYKIRVNANSDSVNTISTYAINLVAGFSTPVITNNRDSFCKGLVSTFKVTPNTAGLTYKWLKNNVIMANETKDSLLVDSAFTYRAIVSNTGCSDTSNAKYLTVYPNPTVNFTSPASVCFKNTIASFALVNSSTISSGTMSHNWIFSDNTISNLLNPTKTVTDTGNLGVKLISTSNNGCTDSVSKTVHVHITPAALYSVNDSTQCVNGNSFLFTNQSNAYGQSVQYNWNFGVGNNVISNSSTQTYNYANVGNYSVRLIAASTLYNCADTFLATTAIYPKPTVNFTSPASVCFKNTIASFALVNTSSINSGTMSHNWLFSDTTTSNLLNPTKTVTDTGNLVVKLISTSNNGCTDSVSKTVNIRKAPKAFFLTYDTAQCITNNYFEFWNQSEDNGLSNQYTWHFGVGNNVISNNLFRFFAYNFSGTYTVKLIALSSNNCADTFNQIVNVVDKATAVNFAINKTAQCLSNNNFVFTNQSTPNNSSLKYKWYFGNGDTSTLLSPNYHYNTLGGTSVKLVVTANNECLDSITKNISVNAEAVANFTINNAAQCLTGNSFGFTNSATNSNTQTWSFGDASNSTVLNPTKTYTNAGSFAVKLVAKNNANCNDSITKTVAVYPSANLSFGINNASQCLKNNAFNFTNTSSISSGSATYKWVLGEADTTTNTSKTFTQIGNYKIYLLSLTNQNCADSFSKDIVVKASPTIGTITGNVTPNSTSTPFAYSILSQANSTYNWTTTGTIQSGQGTNAVNIIWPSVGTGNLKAQITNSNNCTDSTNLLVSITSVGLQNLSLENDLKVYPNPTKSSITITNKTNLAGKKYIITNLVGQLVLSGKLNLDETIVNLETLQSGIYLLSIDGMNKQSIKVIKE